MEFLQGWFIIHEIQEFLDSDYQSAVAKKELLYTSGMSLRDAY